MKKTVIIFGATGMLGSAVYNVFKNKYNLVLAIRDPHKIQLLEKKYGGVKNHKVVKFDAIKPIFKNLQKADFAINGIGLVIAPSKENPNLAMLINGKFPHQLAKIYGPKLIHITTDCVFDGLKGYPYDENSPKTPVDTYSLSKSLGEPTNCLTLRTSIIGRELETYSGLLEWFLHQKEPVVTGFANHFWNGITTVQFAKICDQIFSNRDKFPKSGLFHIFSNVVSKYDMLVAFKKKYKLKVKIQKDTTRTLHRELSTRNKLNSSLKIPPFRKQIDILR